MASVKLFVLLLAGIGLMSQASRAQMNFFKELKGTSSDKKIENDTCFCKLQGEIDDCSCHITTVDRFNNFKIFPRLGSILTKDYFRYFQIDLKKPCPFWTDDGSCVLESCSVTACHEDQLPMGLKGQKSKANRKKILTSTSSCDEDLGSVNISLSEESQAGFERWKAHDEGLVDFCTVRDDDVDFDMQYVDLLLNPERYTGYKGPSAHRVWSSIYNENCFKNSISYANIVEPFGSELNKSNETCIEKRTFYKAISGLHSSINIHLSAKYLLFDAKSNSLLRGSSEPEWGPNATEFRLHFDRPEAYQEGFSWLKNIYFLYLLELKAVSKASPFLRNFDFYTGNQEEDSDLKRAMDDLLRVVESFPSHFEETALFSNNDAPKLKVEFHERFTNITRIMDCVGCQKCKLWGKIQIKGLGTALKVLFSEPSSFRRGIDFLTRNEIVALINAFGRLSESIYELENFRTLLTEPVGNKEEL